MKLVESNQSRQKENNLLRDGYIIRGGLGRL